MACGTPVLASDLPVMREVGGEAAAYCPVGEVDAWRGEIVRLLACRAGSPGEWAALRQAGVRRAALFSWEEAARRVVDVYRDVHAGTPAPVPGANGGA
jgi:glycosyltransferase involved in cell wall biosynthesis